MMDDNDLTKFREAPRPEFAKALYERIDRPAPARSLGLPAMRWRSALPAAATVAALALLFCFPSVRAAAEDFLDLFRVKRFAAIPVDPARLQQLKDRNIDVKTLLADDIQELKRPGEPQLVGSVDEASALAGIPVRAPSTLPANTVDAPEIRVTGEGEARLTADAGKLRDVLETLGIDDVQVPDRLDGATVTVDVPPAVEMRYQRGNDRIRFVQARSPEISLPEGVDLAELGEIGLRIAGMSASEAHTFAHSVDWHSTLLVPVPADAASFREVTVQGTTGLLITSGGAAGGAARGADGERPRSMLLWSNDGVVYAMMGGASREDLLEMANSVR